MTTMPEDDTKIKNHPLWARWVRWLFFAVLGFILFIALVWAGLQTRWAKDRLAGLAVSASSGTDSYRVTLDGLDGLLPFSMVIDRVTLSDAKGVWLEARKADLSLMPAALLEGILEVKWFRMERLSICRRPESTSAPHEKSEAVEQEIGPISLPHIMVHEIRIDRIDLGRDMAGAPMAYSLQSNARTSGQHIDIQALLHDLDHQNDVLRLTAAYDLGTRKMATNLTYEESRGGLAAGLMDLSDVEGITLHLKADGPLSHVKGRLNLEMGGYGTAGLDYQVGLGGTMTVDVEGQIRPENRLIPEQATAALGGLNLDIACRAVLSHGESLQIEAFTARAPSTTISLKGTADLAKGLMDVQVTASPVDISPFLRGSGVEYQALGPVHLTAKGPFVRPEVTATTTLSEVRAQGATFKEVSLEARAAFERDFKGLHKASAWFTVQKLQAPQTPALKGPLRVDVAAKSPDFRIWDVKTLHLTAPEVEVSAAGGRLDTTSGHFSADLLARINRLAPFLPPEAGDMDGTLEMRARAEGNYTTRQIGADLNLVLKRLSGLPRMAAGAVGPDLTFDTRAAIKDDILNLEQVHLSGGHMDLEADGRLNMKEMTFDAQYHLFLKDLASMAEAMRMGLSGNVEGRGRAIGGFDDFAASMDLSSEQLRVNDLDLKEIHMQLEAEGLPQRPSGSIRMKGAALDQPFQLTAGFAWSGETLALSRAEAGLPGIDLHADFEILPAKKRFSGTAGGKIKSLELLSALSGLEAEGSGDFRLKAGGPAHERGATLDGEFKDLHYKGHSVSTLRIKAHVDDVKTLRGQMSLEAADVAFHDTRLRTLKLNARGALNGAVVNLEAKGSAADINDGAAADAPISLTAGLHVQHEEMWRFRLDLFKVSYKGLDVGLGHPATFTIRDGEIALDDLQLHTAKGNLQARAQLGPKTMQASARVTDLPLALFEPFIGRDLSGTASAKCDISGPPGDPAMHVEVHIRDHLMSRGDGSAPLVLEARLNADRRGDRFEADLELSGLDNIPFAARASIPAHLSLKPFAFDLDTKRDLHGNLKGRMDLAVLQGAPGMDGQTIEGLVEVDMGVEGPLEKWLLNGGISISRGRYENVEAGVMAADINGRLNAEGRTLRLTRLTATDGDAGTTAIEGNITTAPPFPMDADLTFNQATLLRKEILTSTASGKLDLKGDMKRLDLTGEIVLDRTELTIPRRLPPDVVEIPVQEINLPPGMSAAGTQPQQGSNLFFMDVSVQIPARFFVRGRGLDAEFKGRLSAKGPANNPVIRGTLKVARGTFQFLSRTFHITDGEIAFDGATPPVPFLNIITQVTAGQIEAQVRVTGPADAFSVILTSQPPLPQDEIIANILFGRSVAKLNAFQAYQLAASISQISGGDIPDIMGATRRTLGLDRLSISGGDTSKKSDRGPTVSAGKYVSEGVYVGVEQELTDAKQDVVVEVEITPNFSVESKAGTRSGAGLGFNWKYDY